jgi:hypothetical protein
MKPKLLEATLGGGRLLKRKSSVLMVAAFGAAGLYGAVSAFAAPPCGHFGKQRIGSPR